MKVSETDGLGWGPNQTLRQDLGESGLLGSVSRKTPEAKWEVRQAGKQAWQSCASLISPCRADSAESRGLCYPAPRGLGKGRGAARREWAGASVPRCSQLPLGTGRGASGSLRQPQQGHRCRARRGPHLYKGAEEPSPSSLKMPAEQWEQRPSQDSQ